MPYRILYRGCAVTCDTPEEVDALLARGSSPNPARRRSSRPRSAERDAATAERALRLLRVVEEAGDAGADPNDLSEKVGLTGARGLGAVMPGVRKLVEAQGLEFSQVMTRERTAEGTVWRRGAAIQDAILRVGSALPSPNGQQEDEESP